MHAANDTGLLKISRKLHVQIKVEAAQKRRTVRAHVEDILEKYFARKGKK